jgi:hypothetical protein
VKDAVSGMTDESRNKVMTHKCDKIAEHLLGIIENGLVVSRDTLFFAESTYGLGGEELESALSDPEFEDRDIILELVFFPNHQMRSMVERNLADSIFKREHEQRILEQLVCAQKSVQLRIVDSELSFRVSTSRNLLASMVEKLYIRRVLDQKICAALQENVSAETARSAKILLRCRGDRFSDTTRNFLCSLIKKASDRGYDFEKLFHLSLMLLAEMGQQTSAEAYFLEQKLVLADKLRNIREFERRRDQHGMEYLMMQRYQVPHESEDDVLDQLQLLTTITDDLLRLLPPSVQYIQQRSLGEFNSKEDQDMDKLFRTLS